MSKYISGLHAIEEALKKGLGMTLFIGKHSKRNEHLKTIASEKGVSISNVKMDEIDALIPGDSHRGVLLEIKEQRAKKVSNTMDVFEFIDTVKEKEHSLVLILDGITDPHNYGAIIRSADQFGADCVITPDRRSAKDSNVVASISSGAVFSVNTFTVTNLARTIDHLKNEGYWIYGADMKGEQIDKTNLKGLVALVMGSEGKGLHRLIEEKCDVLVSIPSLGQVDSLNVSVAAGVMMYEVKRQQKFYS